jgi:hypothetical protein
MWANSPGDGRDQGGAAAAVQSDKFRGESDTLGAKATVAAAKGDSFAAKVTKRAVFAADPVNLSTSPDHRLRSLQRRLALLPCPRPTNTPI